MRRSIYLLLVLGMVIGCVGTRISIQEEGELKITEILKGKLLIMKLLESPYFCELIIMDANLSDYHVLYKGNIMDGEWALDGKRIVFREWGEDKKEGEKWVRRNTIYIINSDGTGLKKVYSIYSNIDVRAPSFSPDGERIVFVKDDEICIIDINGMNFRQLTNNSRKEEKGYITREYKYFPLWSPDGKKIIFSGEKEIWNPIRDEIKREKCSLFIMNSDGSDIKKIVLSDDKEILSYSWSPDGKKIAFSAEGMHRGIYIINPDGTGLRLITKRGKRRPCEGHGRPYWLSEEMIVYTYDVYLDPIAWPFYLWRNKVELWVVNVDGTNERLIKRWKGNFPDKGSPNWWLPKAEIDGLTDWWIPRRK